ncbi:hypothetical protein QMT40_000648 [Parvibaculaceae bacterium PLY_AMNH_Bact1]|nr:hypothetical protein QMT40_000648 [Parvibaculaceae bacterium PLY_AMNH_Bact1]
MIFPSLFLATSGFDLPLVPGLTIGLLYGAPVMFGWTLLLIWANNDPMGRKGVVLCLVPVVMAYIAVEIVAISMDVVTTEQMAPTFILQSVLLVLLISGYKVASSRAN